MLEQTISIILSTPGIADNAKSQLRQEYQAYQYLFDQQSASIRQHLESQATLLTRALVNRDARVHYSLPEAVTVYDQSSLGHPVQVPAHLRSQSIGGLLNHIIHIDLQAALSTQLSQLEHFADPAVSTSAALLRHALVIDMVHHCLPNGARVQYGVEDGEEIPCTPVLSQAESGSMASGESDDRVKGTESRMESGAYPEVATESVRDRFFMPQWVVIDDHQQLLTSDLREAESDLLAMKRYLSVLNAAVELAPYIVVDEDYQNKHYGILGQLVNQGRALASYQAELLCQTIKRRAAAHELDRGLSISLPYFNDQTLTMETYDFDVIPVGMVMFVPAFVVLAVRAQGAKVAQNTRLNQSTRKNLLKELCILERAFLR